MTRRAAQLNIRSDDAKRRVAELVAETGKSATQIVEDAVRAYRPPPPVDEMLPEGVVRDGRFLVFASNGRRQESIEETIAAIADDRDRELFRE